MPVGLRIIQFARHVDPQRFLAARSVKFADQRDIDSIAADDRVEIQIDVPIEIHLAVADQRNRVAQKLQFFEVDRFALDFKVDIASVESRPVRLPDFEQLEHRKECRKLINFGLPQLDRAIAPVRMGSGVIAGHSHGGKAVTLKVF